MVSLTAAQNPDPLLTVPPTTSTANATLGTFATDGYRQLAIGVNITAASGTTPTFALAVDVRGADGVFYQVWQSKQLTGVGQLAASLGPAMPGLDVLAAGAAQGGAAAWPVVLTDNARLRVVIGGTTPSFTYTASVIGS